MCKVFAMTNMKNVRVTKKFINAVKAEVCRTGDKHGFGYAVQDENGDIAGERTLKPLEFQPLQPDPKKTVTGALPIVKETRNRFGKANFNKAKAFIAHGRFSTNTINLENTHPFSNGKVALIHNGVVDDEDGAVTPYLKTDNDTEILLRCWERGGIKLIEKAVTGYYAVALLDEAGQLNIIKDSIAPLHIAYSKTVDSYIIATTADIVRTVAKKMDWHIEQAEELLDDTHIVFNGNEIVSHNTISPRVGYSSRVRSKASAAFGTGSSRGGSGYDTSMYSGYGDDYYGGAYGYGGYRGGTSSSTSSSSSGAGTIVDATVSSSTAGKTEVTAPEEEPIPSYRENATASTDTQETFAESVTQGEADRQFIDDGCPNVSLNESYEGSSYDEGAYQSAYTDDTTRKIS